MRRSVFPLLFALIACGEPARRPGTPGPNGPKDAGSDAGAIDGGLGLDGGLGRDGGPFDGGPGFDGGPFDAGRDGGPDMDAGQVVDSGTSDSGVQPYCIHICTTPADCVIPPGNGIADADNYACSAGRCSYLGCRSDLECMSTFSADYVCRVSNGFGAPSCLKACSTANDCAVDGVPLFDAAHYTCNGGGCEWNGCFTDDDCRSGFNDPRYRCVTVPSLPFDNCMLSCNVPVDCVANGSGPGFDADNYACQAGMCSYTGCNSTAECQAQSGTNYVCEP